MGRKQPRKDLLNPGANNLAVSHGGTELSCNIMAAKDAMSLQIVFTGGTEQKFKTIQIQGNSPVSIFCPSVEGTVILCFLQSGEEQIYDALNGKLLSKKELNERGDRIHFYS